MTTTSRSHARIKRLLLICSLPPYPARANGFSVRYAPILDSLAGEFEVHVVMVADVPIEATEVAEVRKRVHRLDLLERQHRKPAIGRRLLARMISLVPVVLPYPVLAYDLDEIEAFISASVGQTEYDALILASPRYASICERKVRARRKVIDAIDSVSLLFERSDDVRVLDRLDLARIRQWERSLARRWDAVSYISEKDVRAIYGSEKVPETVVVLPNGVFVADDDSPSAVTREAKRVAFLGNMGYAPNVSAVHRLIRLMTEVRKVVPDAVVSVIGRGSAEVLHEYIGADGVDIRGTVDSIWPELRAASVCCFPMTEGAGQQNKVIEAMWAECAVVTSTIGNSGVGAIDGRDLAIVDSDEAIVKRVIDLLQDPMASLALGKAGRAFVEDRFDAGRCVARARRALLGDLSASQVHGHA